MFSANTILIALVAVGLLVLVAMAAGARDVAKRIGAIFKWFFTIPHRWRLRREERRQMKLKTKLLEEQLKNEELWGPGKRR